MPIDLNLPYALELAAMSLDQDVDMTEVAERNGVPRDVLERAIRAVQNLPESPRDSSHWVHALYFIDGWIRGYIDEGTYPDIFACGQLAEAHYRTE